MIVGFVVTQHALPFQPCILVISSGAEGAVEKSLDFMGPVTHQQQDPSQPGFNRPIRPTFFARNHFFSWDSRVIASRTSR